MKNTKTGMHFENENRECNPEDGQTFILLDFMSQYEIL
jgi:hypothetical protein